MQMTYRSVPASKFFFGVPYWTFSRLYGVALVCDLLHQTVYQTHKLLFKDEYESDQHNENQNHFHNTNRIFLFPELRNSFHILHLLLRTGCFEDNDPLCIKGQKCRNREYDQYNRKHHAHRKKKLCRCLFSCCFRLPSSLLKGLLRFLFQ